MLSAENMQVDDVLVVILRTVVHSRQPRQMILKRDSSQPVHVVFYTSWFRSDQYV